MTSWKAPSLNASVDHCWVPKDGLTSHPVSAGWTMRKNDVSGWALPKRYSCGCVVCSWIWKPWEDITIIASSSSSPKLRLRFHRKNLNTTAITASSSRCLGIHEVNVHQHHLLLGRSLPWSEPLITGEFEKRRGISSWRFRSWKGTGWNCCFAWIRCKRNLEKNTNLIDGKYIKYP